MDKEFQTWLEEHKEYCSMLNRYLHLFARKTLQEKFSKIYLDWANIDRKKDKSLSSQDFRFYLYLKLVGEHQYGE